MNTPRAVGSASRLQPWSRLAHHILTIGMLAVGISSASAQLSTTTLAGSPLQTGSTNATGSLARFNNPQGVAVDSAGNIYVADAVNHKIRKVTSVGVVTTLAGSGSPG